MSVNAPSLLIRAGVPADRDTIVDFNQRLAGETEGKALDLTVLSAGIRSALADPERLRYWVAQPSAAAPLVGQAAITREWSDWRNGWIWWFQSVYVIPEARGQGVFRALYQQIRAEALALPDVIGLRLYVEQENHRAKQTYLAMGMEASGYHVFEEIWTDRFAASSLTPG
ncbi:Acetyltransferase (GNAT) family protein [Singulisphaera sp. GP187]|uniref:GNAT family N-acetyltransferase n=1 Tax=Singulisphaera sp. GP187 TaxID=1882752 RepID=UPI00092C1C65|nr:GNAT family N-acetyltransferase [Singulisphaera sp. GP187]SIN80598.1 Acetyltransferase (GNAT) family protein [Singulisphaera sp. GP187]